MNLDWLNKIRLGEVEVVCWLLRNKLDAISVLEIGAGNGIQAKHLQESGFKVKAIDVQSSAYKGLRFFSVQEYNGIHIPYTDESFDVIYSSNVLEHIPYIHDFLETEMKRVLKDRGVSIHVVPSLTWRFWSNVTHYIDIPARIVRFIKKKNVAGRNDSGGASPEKNRLSSKVLSYLLPLRHGERGNGLIELYFFSRFGWTSLFKQTGWSVTQRVSSGLFYTGSSVLGASLPISTRRMLSKILGSSTHIYVLKNEQS